MQLTPDRDQITPSDASAKVPTSTLSDSEECCDRVPLMLAEADIGVHTVHVAVIIDR